MTLYKKVHSIVDSVRVLFFELIPLPKKYFNKCTSNKYIWSNIVNMKCF